jgi:hypothetical protein
MTAAADLPAAATVNSYGAIFMQIAGTAVVVGCLLLVISPLLKRWMH